MQNRKLKGPNSVKTFNNKKFIAIEISTGLLNLVSQIPKKSASATGKCSAGKRIYFFSRSLAKTRQLRPLRKADVI